MSWTYAGDETERNIRMKKSQIDRQRGRQGVAAKDRDMWGRAVTLCC